MKHVPAILLVLSLTACDSAGTVASTGLAASNTITTSALATSATIAQLTVCVLVLALVGVIGVIGFVAVRGMQFALAIRYFPREASAPSLPAPKPAHASRTKHRVNAARQSAVRAARRMFK